MASLRQVRDWIGECLRRHMDPDVLEVQTATAEARLFVHTRAVGTEKEPGGLFSVDVAHVAGEGAPPEVPGPEAEAVRQARRRLRHIEEQIEKRQYWNALAALNEAERYLQRAFDVVLKEKR